MKVVILYQPRSEQASAVETFVHDFTYRHDSTHLEAIDADSREGSALSELYGVVSYPTILVLRDNGSLVRSWEGDMLPLIDEVTYYTFNQG